MNSSTKSLLSVVAVVAIIGAQRWLFSDSAVAQLSSTSIQGEIISLEPASTKEGGQSEFRDVMVKLSSGETVRASVRSGHAVVPGQTARLAKYGDGPPSSSYYMVIFEKGQE
jgi:hypothetical protein